MASLLIYTGSGTIPIISFIAAVGMVRMAPVMELGKLTTEDVLTV